MSQWTKRRAAGLARGIMIGLILAITIWIFYTTGVLTGWLDALPLGVAAFLDLGFWTYVLLIIFIVGMITMFVRSMIAWGGAS